PSEFDFTVTVDYKQQPVTGMNYEDKATFDLTVKLQKDNGSSATIILSGTNYQNYAPTCVPLTMNYSNGSSWACVPGSIGVTNVTDISLLSFTDSTATIQLEHSGAEHWGAHTVDAHGDTGDAPKSSLGSQGFPSIFTIALKDESQIIPDGLGGS